MKIIQDKEKYRLYKENEEIGAAVLLDGRFTHLEIVPAWRGRGYGSYLLKEVLRQNGGFEKERHTVFTAPPPESEAGWALAAKFSFARCGEGLRREKKPELSAVQLCHEFLEARLSPGGLLVDATCGNGHDTLFLCGLAGKNGRVLGLDIQPAAVEATNALLARHGRADIGHAVLHDHADLLALVGAGTADCVLFNFGWLPGAAHTVHSTAENSVKALEAALTALRPGGILAAVLYSGKVIGNAEKTASLRFFESLPLTRYTVLVCRFANWDDTAPLPCFVLKK